MESDANELKSERYAHQLVRNAFQIFDPNELEKNEQAKDIYEQLKEGLKAVFDEFMPVSPRCPVCGKMRKEPTRGLMAYEMVDRLREAYERTQLPAGTRTLCEQLFVANRLDMISVCAEFQSRHVVLAAEATG